MEWLTEYKIPVGDAASAVFEWIRDNGEFVLDAMSTFMEGMIDGILWILQEPPELIVILAFVAITYALQRNWKTALFVFAGFLFILALALTLALGLEGDFRMFGAVRTAIGFAPAEGKLRVGRIANRPFAH